MRLNNKGHIKESICLKCRKDRLIIWSADKTAKKIRYGTYIKGSICELCNFTGELCQFDVNHIDGNHKNNKDYNLQTLCANCHRLVTKQNKHGIYGITNYQLKNN